MDEPKVVLVVGAGVSIASTGLPHASWSGLLRHGLHYRFARGDITIRRRDELLRLLEDAFSPFDLDRALSIAESIERELQLPDARGYTEWLRGAFQHFKASDSITLDLIRDLQRAGALVMTTNYDGLLEDATDLPPVTWEDHHGFFRVMDRQETGILHIHGHWETPSSVVLGRTSYQRVIAAENLQVVFKSLWMHWTWVYLGCGDGLDDENLGRVLRWGSDKFGVSARKAYFFGKQDAVDKLQLRSDKPVNLQGVPYADHRNLPDLLRALSEMVGSTPFQRLDEDHPQFRHARGDDDVPFPTRQEYVLGEVPAFASDAIVERRLEEKGWAFVMDKASVGKTTLALRLATSPLQRDLPVFYLDLARFDAHSDPTRVLHLLTRPGVLIIVDNTHHEPELSRQIWDIWHARTRESRLLLISTEMQRLIITDAVQDQSFFISNLDNPPIPLQPTPEDLCRIVMHLHRRIGGADGGSLPTPPRAAVEAWHRDYGTALGAFSLGVLGHLAAFANGNWNLPLSAAAEWVRKTWLKNLKNKTLENLLCICAFGEQELELPVSREALPHPGEMEALMIRGLLQVNRGGKLKEIYRFSLREPSWGPLILEAQPDLVATEDILEAAATRHWSTASALLARLWKSGNTERGECLAAAISAKPDVILSQIGDAELIPMVDFVDSLTRLQQDALAAQIWTVLLQDCKRAVARAWETPLDQLSAFLERAKDQEGLVAAIWEGLADDPQRLAALALQSPLLSLHNLLERAAPYPDLIRRICQHLGSTL